MKRTAGLHILRDEAASLAAALLLHFMVLYCMWNYHVTPPPTEAVTTVFVSVINPPAAVTQKKQVSSKPDPDKQKVPIKSAPVLPKPMAHEAPAISSTEQVAAPVQTYKVQTYNVQAAAVPENVTATDKPARMTPANSGKAQLPQPLLMGGELSVSCSERTAPTYPKQSLRLGEQGKTVLLVELDEMGRMITVEVKTKSGFPRLDEAAVNAVKTWRCTPAKRNGVAVRSIALQPFNFTLKGR